MVFVYLFANNFSMILDIIGKRLIGRWDVTSFGGFPGLGMSMTDQESISVAYGVENLCSHDYSFPRKFFHYLTC